MSEQLFVGAPLSYNTSVANHRQVALQMASALFRSQEGSRDSPRLHEEEGGEPSAKRARDAATARGPNTPSSGLPRELSVSVPNSDLDLDKDLLLEHIAFQSKQVEFMQLQLNSLTDLIRHQNKCFAMYCKRKEFEEDAPPIFNPLVDQPPVPDPKSKREGDFRDMTMMELKILERELKASLPFKRMRDNVRKIVDPENWYKSTILDLDLQELPNKQLWKLWALARNKARIDNVLTPTELSECAKPPSMSAAALTIAVDRASSSFEAPPTASPAGHTSSSKRPMEPQANFQRAVPGAHSPALQKSFSEEDLGEIVAGEAGEAGEAGMSAMSGSSVAPMQEDPPPPPPPRISGTPANASTDTALHDARSARNGQTANAKAQSSRRRAINQIGALKKAAKTKSKDFVDSDDDENCDVVDDLFGSDDGEGEWEEEEEEESAQPDAAGNTSEASGA